MVLQIFMVRCTILQKNHGSILWYFLMKPNLTLAAEPQNICSTCKPVKTSKGAEHRDIVEYHFKK